MLILQRHPTAAPLWFRVGSSPGFQCSFPRYRERAAWPSQPRCIHHHRRSSSASRGSWGKSKSLRPRWAPRNVAIPAGVEGGGGGPKGSGSIRSVLSDLFTRSCSFCMGSGSPSRPHVRISLPSYTLMMRSAVLMRKQLQGTEEQSGWGSRTAPARTDAASSFSPAFASKLNGLDGCGVAGACGHAEGGHQLLSVGVQHQDLSGRRQV